MKASVSSERSGRLGVGVVGCGDQLRSHLPAWQKTAGCEILGFFDVAGDRASKAAAAVPGAVAFPSLQALIERCDVVDVCSPPRAHAEACLAALETGRDVLVEKPVTASLEDWSRIRTCAERSRGKLAAYHQQKLGWHVLQAKRWLDEGRLGQVVGVTGEYLVDPVSDPLLAVSDHWVNELPGGRWFEVLPHLLYVMELFAGHLTTADVVISRSAQAPSAAEADGVAVTLVGARCLATLLLSAASSLDRRAIVVHGSRGQVEIALLRGVSTFSPRMPLKSRRLRYWLGTPFLEAGYTLLQWLPDRMRCVRDRCLAEPSLDARLVGAFVRYIRNEGPPPTTLDEMDSVMRSCAAIGEGIEARLRRDAAEESGRLGVQPH